VAILGSRKGASMSGEVGSMQNCASAFNLSYSDHGCCLLQRVMLEMHFAQGLLLVKAGVMVMHANTVPEYRILHHVT
jgi:hypothetical protein